MSDVLAPGDVIYVAPKEELSKDADDDEKENVPARRMAGVWCKFRKSRAPLIVMDPHTGRVLAVVGGSATPAAS